MLLDMELRDQQPSNPTRLTELPMLVGGEIDRGYGISLVLFMSMFNFICCVGVGLECFWKIFSIRCISMY